LGVAGDIAGAIALALSFMTKSPAKIAGEAPVHGVVWGNAHLAQSLCRQREEARVGAVLLVAGFGAQGIVYFLAGGNASVEGWRETAVAFGLMAIPFAALAGLCRWWVPWAALKTWEQTWPLNNRGEPLQGEELEKARERFRNDQLSGTPLCPERARRSGEPSE
jgi:hypothetical protein